MGGDDGFGMKELDAGISELIGTCSVNEPEWKSSEWRISLAEML
jgi:hypothetical protein